LAIVFSFPSTKPFFLSLAIAFYLSLVLKFFLFPSIEALSLFLPSVEVLFIS
jgi:hypothetical protein